MRAIEYRYWSPIHGRECLRLMAADSEGQEYFCIIPAEEGAQGRLKRREALDVLEEAIMDPKIKPGEIVWRNAL